MLISTLVHPFQRPSQDEELEVLVKVLFVGL